MQARVPREPKNKTNTDVSVDEDLEREVYGVFGIPIDNVDISTALGKIRTAVAKRRPFLISTANLNFLVTSQLDAEFRSSLLLSDLVHGGRDADRLDRASFGHSQSEGRVAGMQTYLRR